MIEPPQLSWEEISFDVNDGNSHPSINARHCKVIVPPFSTSAKIGSRIEINGATSS